MKNSTQKNLSTLVNDIYDTVSDLNIGEKQIPDELLADITAGIGNAIIEWATPRDRSNSVLRMSSIGKPSRQLYYADKYKESSPPDAATLIKFLYGHILEELLLFLVKLAGHEVTDQQKEVNVKNIKGHMDCKIDGEVIDVKSASGFSFKKFQNGTLRENDPFGYMYQLAGYEKAEGTNDGGFLAINKESGEVALYQPEELDKPNVESRIDDLIEMFSIQQIPDKCYQPIPAGTKGNMKLPMGCVYCPHKIECHSDTNNGKGLRMFKYAKGIEYLTSVRSLPRVEEII
jgi:hypothetical protein